MEKIKDALNKAKAKNAGSGAVTTEVKKSLHSSRVSSMPAIGPEITAKDTFSSIVYRETSVVNLNPTILENNRIVSQNKHDPSSWAFDSLRTKVLQKMENNNWNTLAVVSPTPSSGKSIVSINLAISIAQQYQKTAVLVDFDFRKPRIAQYLGIKCKKSINDWISGDAKLSEVMINPGIPRLTIVPTNKSIAQSAEILASNKIKELIIELKERYESRIVIFDLPPLLNVDDALVILPQVDCVLFVVGDRHHSEYEIGQSMQLLDKYNLLGVVVNRAEIESKPYY